MTREVGADFGEDIGNVVIIVERAPDDSEDQAAVARNEQVPGACGIPRRKRCAPDFQVTLRSQLKPM
jgi:hypothetical protein